MKVVQNWYADGWMVVADDWGEQRETPTGVKFRYEPIPICRVNTGFGRTLKEAEDIANRICRLLNDEERYYEETDRLFREAEAKGLRPEEVGV